MAKISNTQKLLEVKNLNKVFVSNNARVHAVNDVSFELNKGETIGLIGESGSGKTTIGRTIIRLNDPTSGQIILKGTNIGQKKLSKDSKKILRSNIQMIFQDPYSSLNEQMNIMNIIAEPIKTLKLDKKYLADFLNGYDEIIKYYKYFLVEKIDKLRNDNEIKNKKFAISEFEKEVKRLKTFEITANSKWEEIEALTSLYYGVKIDGNATITNNSLSVSKDILSLWDTVKEELSNGKVFTETEKELKIAEDNVKLFEKLSKNTKEYFELLSKLKAVEKYNAIFRDYVSESVKTYKDTVKGLISIIKDQASENLIKAKTSKDVAGYNFSLLESFVKKFIVRKLSTKGDTTFAVEIIEATEKFERKAMIDLHSEFKRADVHSKISLSNDGLIIDGQEADLTKTWDNLIGKTIVSNKDIVKNFISNSKELLKELSSSEIKTIKGYKFDELDKMLDIEAKLKIDAKEIKKISPKEEYAEKLQIAKTKFEELNAKNESLKEEWLVSFNSKQKLAKEKFEKEIAKVNDKLEKIVNETKRLYVLNNEMIINSSLPWFMDKEYKNPSAVFDKKKIALQKHFSNINLSLEAETDRVIKDNDMLKEAIVGGKLNKRKVKEYLVREKVFEVLEEAGLTKAHAFRYPHEFSGGMRQRVGIARAIVSQPDIIVADEPIAALDLSIQAQIANLLKSMQDKREMSMIFIAHDLSMVKHISDRILIIHLGRIVESGTTKEIFDHPVHPYTKNLIKSMPDISRISAGFENNNFEGKYLNGYTVVNQPEYINVKGTHKVLATKAQFKTWTK